MEKFHKALSTTPVGINSPKGKYGDWKFSYPVIETHFHLDYLKNRSQGDIVAHAVEMGIERMITISVDEKNIHQVIPMAERFDQVFTTQGIHPHHAKEWSDEIEKQIRQTKGHPKVVAIGEIGLDYYYDHSPRDKQLQVFRRQLELAIEANLPIIVHSRDADEDTIQILREFAPQLKKRGVVHSFTSGMGLLETALDLGFSIGFNGIITFKNAANVRQALAATPLDKILIETDAPFLTPAPFRGEENNPTYLPFVATAISQQKQIEAIEVLKQIYKNSIDLFFNGR